MASYYRQNTERLPSVFLWLLAGVVCILGGWLLPVSWKSVHPVLLEFAGKGTPSVGQTAKTFLETGKTGPASILLEVAKSNREAGLEDLTSTLQKTLAGDPVQFVWGGRDQKMEMLFSTNTAALSSASNSLVRLFMSDGVREVVHPHLAASVAPGVQALLRTEQIEAYERFVPAMRPGGQALQATILLTTLLYGGEYFSPTAALEVKSAAELALNGQNIGELENIYYSVLVLGSRLNWAQITEVLPRFSNVGQLIEFSTLLNNHPDRQNLLYATAVMTENAGNVASFLLAFGESGFASLEQGSVAGEGAVRLLMERQVPVAAVPGGTLAAAAPFILKWPEYMLGLKYFLFVLGGIFLLRAWSALATTPSMDPRHGVFGVQDRLDYGIEPVESPGWGIFRFFFRLGLIALVVGALTAMSEPLFFRNFNPAKIQPGYRIAGLSNSPVAKKTNETQPAHVMEQTTLISILLFALLQIFVYMICLMKIREIDLQPISPTIKLRLMDNEENLFDGGLYVGIAGTAGALVMQVMQMIEANLLAAYASNLFGIMCVAMVKIGHVRAFKRQLILQMQAEQGGYQQRV